MTIKTHSRPTTVGSALSSELTLSPRLRPWLIVLGLLVATAVVFAAIPQQGFMAWDDGTNIFDNPYMNPVTLPHVLYFWDHAYYSLYMPVTYTVWSVVAAVARLPQAQLTPTYDYSNLNPEAFHLVSLFFHLSCVVLVFIILRGLLKDDASAGVGALFFGIHPLQVQSVASITGLNNILAGFFSLVAIRLYLLGAEGDRSAASVQRRYFSWAFLAFVLALLSKPMAVTTPLMAWVLDRWMIGRPNRESARTLAPWFLFSALCVGATHLAQGSNDRDIVIPLWGRPFVAGNALTFYLAKLVMPINLCIDYGSPPNVVLHQTQTFFVWLVPALLVYLLYRNRTRVPQLWAAFGIFVSGLLPVLGFFPFYLHRISTVGDRYVYLSMLGAALAVGWTFSRTRNPLERTVYMALLFLCGFGAAMQTLYWSNNTLLFEHTIAVNPQSWSARNNLGNILGYQGKVAAAEDQYRIVIALKPNFAEGYAGLGVDLMTEGRFDAAKAQFLRAIALDPDDPLVHCNMAILLARLGHLPEAIREFETALNLDPSCTKARYDLAVALSHQRQHDQSEEQLRQTLVGNSSSSPVGAAPESLKGGRAP